MTTNIKADRNLIDDYYKQRGYVAPNATEALLWLTTEMVELFDAYVKTIFQYEDENPHADRALDLSAPEYRAFLRLKKVRATLEAALERRNPYWVRNHQDQSVPNLTGEIADVYMMLDRLAKALGLPEVEVSLTRKMLTKGFTLDKNEKQD